MNRLQILGILSALFLWACAADTTPADPLGADVTADGQADAVSDVGSPEDTSKPQDVGEPQDTVEPQDVGEPQDSTEPQDVGEPQDMMEPDMMEPDMMEPDMMEPDMMEPDMMEPDMMEPDMMEPDMWEPDVMEADMMEPDMMEPDMWEPDVMEADMMEADMWEPDVAEPDVAESDVGQPQDAGEPGASCPESMELVGQFAIWCGKVNVHIDPESGLWVTDDDCKSGCLEKDLAYCQELYPTSLAIIELPVSPEQKPFMTAGCQSEAPNTGKSQFGCCAPQ